MIVGKNKREGIDFVHDRLNSISRPLAEKLFLDLLREGMIKNEEGSYLVENEESVEEEELRKRAKRLSAQHNITRLKPPRTLRSTRSRQHTLKLKQLNNIDVRKKEEEEKLKALMLKKKH